VLCAYLLTEAYKHSCMSLLSTHTHTHTHTHAHTRTHTHTHTRTHTHTHAHTHIHTHTHIRTQVPTKVNAISIDSCTKTGVVFGDLISSCEAINCSRLQLQCTGSVPTLAIEKTDGVQLYLPEAVCVCACGVVCVCVCVVLCVFMSGCG